MTRKDLNLIHSRKDNVLTSAGRVAAAWIRILRAWRLAFTAGAAVKARPWATNDAIVAVQANEARELKRKKDRACAAINVLEAASFFACRIKSCSLSIPLRSSGFNSPALLGGNGEVRAVHGQIRASAPHSLHHVFEWGGI
jgi:hypothetical protein